MKKIIFSLAILFFITNSFGQTQTTSLSKEDYLQKSKLQKKSGWRLLGAGLGIAAIGGIIQLDNENQRHGSFDLDFTGTYIAIGGGVISLISIPYFIKSSKNKKLAIAIAFDNQNILLPQENNLALKKQPSLCLRIEL
ncbi:MAG: hypothetical protein V4497_02085 [Bacteroidota bacterium]